MMLNVGEGMSDPMLPAAAGQVVAYGYSSPAFAVTQKSSPVSAGAGRCQGCAPVTFTDAQG